MHQIKINTLIARLLRHTSFASAHLDIIIACAFLNQSACFVKITRQRQCDTIENIHIFDWPFERFEMLSAAQLSAAAALLSEQAFSAGIDAGHIHFLFGDGQVKSAIKSLPYSGDKALQADLASAAFLEAEFDGFNPHHHIHSAPHILSQHPEKQQCAVTLSWASRRLLNQLQACAVQANIVVGGIASLEEGIGVYLNKISAPDPFHSTCRVCLSLNSGGAEAFIITPDFSLHKQIDINIFDLILLEQVFFTTQTPLHPASPAAPHTEQEDSSFWPASPFWQDVAVRVSQAISQMLQASLASASAQNHHTDKTSELDIELVLPVSRASPSYGGWQLFSQMLKTHLPDYRISLCEVPVPVPDPAPAGNILTSRLSLETCTDWLAINTHSQIDEPSHPLLLAMATGGALTPQPWFYSGYTQPEQPEQPVHLPDIAGLHKKSLWAKQIQLLRRKLNQSMGLSFILLSLWTALLVWPDYDDAKHAAQAVIPPSPPTSQLAQQSAQLHQRNQHMSEQYTHLSQHIATSIVPQTLFDSVADNVPLQMQLSQFEFQNAENEQSLNISGYSTSRNRINLFADLLAETGWLEHIVTQTQQDTDRDAYYFNLTAQVKLQQEGRVDEK